MQAKLYFSLLLAFIFQGFTGPVFADQDLAKTSQNPVGNIISHHLRTDGSRVAQMVDLRIPACTQILQDLHSHCLDLDSYGHSIQLHTAIDRPVELYTS